MILLPVKHSRLAWFQKVKSPEIGSLCNQEGISHNEFASEKIKITLDELRSERDAVKELGLI